MARFTGGVPESAIRTCNTLGTIIIWKICRTSALLGCRVEYEVVGTAQTLLCSCIIESVSRTCKTLTIREKRRI